MSGFDVAATARERDLVTAEVLAAQAALDEAYGRTASGDAGVLAELGALARAARAELDRLESDHAGTLDRIRVDAERRAAAACPAGPDGPQVSEGSSP